MELYTGIVFTIISIVLSVIYSIAFFVVDQYTPFTFFTGVCLIGIWYKSIQMLNKGLKQQRIDELTDKYGEICYGLIVGVDENYLADILIYFPAVNEVKHINYQITDKFDKYLLGSHVRATYFKGDINILNVSGNNTVPDDIYEKIIEFSQKEIAQNEKMRLINESYKNE